MALGSGVTFVSGVAAQVTPAPDRDTIPSSQQLRRAVEAATARAADAYRRQDIDAFMPCPVPGEPRLRTFGGVVRTCAELRAEIEARMGRVHDPVLRVDIDSLRVGADTGLVFTTQHFSRTVEDAQHASHCMATSVRHREVWVRDAGGWQSRFIEEISQPTVLLDGKAYAPQPRP